jgi:hypothetical protein
MLVSFAPQTPSALLKALKQAVGRAPQALLGNAAVRVEFMAQHRYATRPRLEERFGIPSAAPVLTTATARLIQLHGFSMWPLRKIDVPKGLLVLVQPAPPERRRLGEAWHLDARGSPGNLSQASSARSWVWTTTASALLTPTGSTMLATGGPARAGGATRSVVSDRHLRMALVEKYGRRCVDRNVVPGQCSFQSRNGSNRTQPPYASSGR